MRGVLTKIDEYGKITLVDDGFRLGSINPPLPLITHLYTRWQIQDYIENMEIPENCTDVKKFIVASIGAKLGKEALAGLAKPK